jgi:signal transduction histidine kinase
MTTAALEPTDNARRIEDLGRIILAYSEVTERLQQSYNQMTQTVQSLRQELSEKNRLLERSNRLAALGEMAAGMAHEIRNPLGGIQLYSSMLAKDLSDRPDSLQIVGKISGGVRRLESLVSHVLQFTREMTARIAEVDLAETLEQTVELACSQLQAKNIACTVTGPHPMWVQVDPLLVEQAVLNLILNAADAIDSGGAIVIEFNRPAASGDGKQFNLVVRDTGPGIPPQILDRIFNPFFTTKETGTGLGLAIVHRVVEAHDGNIVVTNVDGGGAKFEIRI